MALYKALAPCVVFDRFREQDEEFNGPDYKEHYGWDMPPHIEVIAADKPKKGGKKAAADDNGTGDGSPDAGAGAGGDQ